MELRVHGVSGTPPVDMLDHPLVKQVAGDTDGRFFRPVDSAGMPLPAQDGHILEGYHWGPQTSGTWRHALWLVLIPFGLVNAAYFMLPAGGGRVARELARGALRVLAVVLTAVYVLGLAQALVGLLAWQWTGLNAGDPHWWLVLAFAGVAAALLVIRFLGGAPKKLPEPSGWTADAPTALAGGEFYTGDGDMTALRHLHLAAGLAVLAVLAAAVADVDWAYWTAVVVLAWSVLHAALLGDPSRRDGVRKLFATVLPVVVMVAGAGALVVAAVLVLFADLPATDRGVLPGTVDVGGWTTVVGPVALGVLVLATAWLAVQTRDPSVPRAFRRYLGGLAGPVVAALGMFLAVGFTAALDYGVLRLLRPAEAPGDMVLPLFYVRIAYAAGAAVLVALAIIVVLLARMAFSARRYARLVTVAGEQREKVRSVALAWWLARVKFGAQWLAVVLAGAGVVLTVAAVWEAGVDDAGAEDTVCRSGGTWLSDCADRPGLDLVTVGTVALLLLGGFLVYLGRRAVGDSAVRRAACVVWDVVAFWPAAVHPFVPPPYSPKVIEDLRRRIAWHLGDCYELRRDGECTCAKPERPADFLVLAGHSQGSLIAAAALTRLSQDCRDRVGLLTFGSQLQVAYARAFPAYVDHTFLCWLQSEVLRRDHWVSLYRETDPIGGPVLSWDRTDEPVFESRRLGGDGVLRADDVTTLAALGVRKCGAEWRLSDPALADGILQPRLAMRRHSSYTLDPVWTLALDRARGVTPDG